MHLLLADSPRLRRRAIRDLVPSPALAYALRRVLFTDRHAEVRAAAARRLGRLDVPEVADWLADALGDGSALVRDGILRALARCGGTGARDRVRARTADDRVWWVRRTAIYALAAVSPPEAAELPAFEAALADPFWRVRHAAVKVLAALGAGDLDVRARIGGDAAPAETLAFLRAAWGPAAVDAPSRAATPSQLPAELLDPDPAVVTARLANRVGSGSPVPLHDACHGFVAGRSTVTNARPHRGAALVLKLDLKDFFPTVRFRRVAGVFRSVGYGAEVARTLAALTTYRPRLPGGDVVWPGMLPQGAPTSPALANLACRRLDRRLALLAAKVGAVYTRYADDLTFSFATRPELRIGRFLWWVDAICEQEGFLERPDKRRILRANHQQRVTGLVVNAGVNVPRADRRRFRAILHNCAAHGIESQARDRDDFTAYLAGYAAYVHMVDPVLGRAWIDEVERLLAQDGHA